MYNQAVSIESECVMEITFTTEYENASQKTIRLGIVNYMQKGKFEGGVMDQDIDSY